MTAVFALLFFLTGIAVSALRKIWFTSTWPKDGDLEIEQPSNSNRGRGSESVDRESLRKLTASHLLMIAEFIDYCNDTTGKVRWRTISFCTGHDGRKNARPLILTCFCVLFVAPL